MDYFWGGTRSGGWQEPDKERAAQQQEDKRLANAANKMEKARVKALEAQGEDPPGGPASTWWSAIATKSFDTTPGRR